MNKKIARIRRATKTRCKIKELGLIRLVIHRTPRHIYAQIITPDSSKILVSASTLEKKIMKQITKTGNKEAAIIIGKTIAERALEKNIRNISFDRSGFKYHGRIQVLANAAREFGLKF